MKIFKKVLDAYVAARGELGNPLTDCDEFTHVNVRPELRNDLGEILIEFMDCNKILWSDMIFKCSHCNADIKGLMNYIQHMNGIGNHKFRLHCFDDSCNRKFSALYSFINHAAEHHLHLNLMCIFCKPSRLFFNAVCLMNHHIDEHKDLNFSLFFCFECAQYFQCLKLLREHLQNFHQD